MQFDYKKVIKTVLYAYLMSGLFLAVGVSLQFNLVVLIIFSLLSILITATSILTVQKTNKKYPNKIFKLLMGTGYFLIIFTILVNVIIILGI